MAYGLSSGLRLRKLLLYRLKGIDFACVMLDICLLVGLKDKTELYLIH